MPKLSIITVNLNDKKGLEKTIKSVVEQSFTDYEFIIIDGGSTDGSINIIKKYSKYISYWISEPDKGIYNAMNKGIAKATGTYFHFLNSGDWLAENSVYKTIFTREHSNLIIYGNYNRIKNMKVNYYKYPAKLTNHWFYNGTLCHQSVIIHNSVFKEVRFDENYKLVSDWILLFNLFVNRNVKFKYVDIIICNYSDDGISSKKGNQLKLEKERTKYIETEFLPNEFNTDYKRLIQTLNLLNYKNTLFTLDNNQYLPVNGFLKLCIEFIYKVNKNLRKFWN